MLCGLRMDKEIYFAGIEKIVKEFPQNVYVY
jgi:hypothetical protein